MGESENVNDIQTREAAIDQVVGRRLGQWEDMINAQLQSLITQASEIRKQITTAKTETKRRYFTKKFTKVSIEVRQMVAAMQRIQSTATNTNHPVVSDASTTPADEV